jgi:hypothetical protein
MKGLTNEQIKKNRADVVARLYAKGHTIIDSILSEVPPGTENDALWYLGKSFQLMAAADAVYFMQGFEAARGCWMEFQACKQYGIKTIEEGND